jgi:hypothetical protein
VLQFAFSPAAIGKLVLGVYAIEEPLAMAADGLGQALAVHQVNSVCHYGHSSGLRLQASGYRLQTSGFRKGSELTVQG